MAHNKTGSGPKYAVIGAIVFLALIATLMALEPPQTALGGVIRAAALVGYVAVFLAIVSSAYMRQMLRLFGRPFLKVHHGLAAGGLILLTLHGLSVALRMGSLSALVPDISSLRAFLLFGGRPAWFLMVVGAAAAIWRTALGRNWRALHALMYVAFFLGTAHAILIGTDWQWPIVQVLSAAMALTVVAVFVQKRRGSRRRRR